MATQPPLSKEYSVEKKISTNLKLVSQLTWPDAANPSYTLYQDSIPTRAAYTARTARTFVANMTTARIPPAAAPSTNPRTVNGGEENHLCQVQPRRCTIWLFNIAMENGPFIEGLPIKNCDFPWLC